MPKRNTTDSAIETLNAADLLAQEAKQELFASIPSPTFVDEIPISQTYSDRSFNVRDDASYGYEANKELFDSLKTFGLQKRNPMAFSLRTDGRYLTLAGNLRLGCLLEIRSSEQERRIKEGVPTNIDNPLPFEYIHGLVYTGLSIEQETAIMADHMMAKSLNLFETAKAIGEFWESHPKMTIKKAAVYFGMDENKVSRLRMRYCMPTVFEEFRKEKGSNKEVSYVKVGNVPLVPLYSAYLNDREAGNKHRQEGPNFRRAWAEFLANPENLKSKKEDDDDSTKPRELSVITNQASACVTTHGDYPEVNAIALTLMWAGKMKLADGTEPNLNTIQTDIKAYCDGLRQAAKEREDYASMLQDTNSQLVSQRKTIEELTLRINDQSTTIEESNVRINGLLGQIEEMHSRKQNGKTSKV